MIFSYLLSTWLSDHYIIKNCVFCWYTTAEKQKLDFFQSLNHLDVDLKPWFLVQSGYHIVPSPSTAIAVASLDVEYSYMGLGVKKRLVSNDFGGHYDVKTSAI